MSGDDFSDAALVLLGHGSTRDPDSVKPAYQHAAALRQRQVFAQVLECFWQVEPGPESLRERLRADRVFLVPLCISEGHLTTELFPRALGLPLGRAPDAPEPIPWTGRTAWYTPPLGTHPALTEVVCRRADDLLVQFPGSPPASAATTSLVIAGHGTLRNDRSRESIDDQVRRLRARQRYAEVQPAFMEQAPSLVDCWRRAATPDVLVVPFFMSDGLHTRQDIPVLLGESRDEIAARRAAGALPWINPTRRDGRRIWYAQAVGTEPAMADLVLDRVRACRPTPNR